MNLNIRFACCSLALFLFTLPFSGITQSTAVNSESLVDKITSDFAIAEKIKEVPHDLRLQFEQNPLNLAPETNEQILAVFSEAYKTKLLVNSFKAALGQKLTGEDVETVSEKLQMPVIKDITEAQQEFYTLQGKRKQIVTKYEMDQNPPSEERTSMIQALVDTTSAADESVESSIIIVRSLIESLMKANQQRPFSEAQLNGIVNNFRSQMQPQASQQAVNDLLITYHNIDDSTLKEYVSFMQSPAGQWLDTIISESIRSAYQEASDRFSASVNSDQ